LRIGPASDDSVYLSAAAPEARLEALNIHGPVPRGVHSQAEEHLTIHFGEAAALPAQEPLAPGAGLLVPGFGRRV
jgi:hypothetical protein